MSIEESSLQLSVAANNNDDIMNDVISSPVSVADSTMNNLQQQSSASSSNTDVGSSVDIRFIVERLPDLKISQQTTADMLHCVEFDAFVNVPSSVPFHRLVHHALSSLGYSDLEIVSCKANVEIKNWNPISVDAVTDNWSSTVADILESISSLVTVRVRLNRPLQCRVIADIKSKLLLYLIHSAQHLLVSTGCPIKQNVLSDISTRASATTDVPLSEDLVSSFHKWFKEQMPDDCLLHTEDSTALNTQHRNVMVFDSTTELPLLHNWFVQDQHPSRADLARFVRVLNCGRQLPSQPAVELSNVENWFRTAAKTEQSKIKDTLLENVGLGDRRTVPFVATDCRVKQEAEPSDENIAIEDFASDLLTSASAATECNSVSVDNCHSRLSRQSTDRDTVICGTKTTLVGELRNAIQLSVDDSCDLRQNVVVGRITTSTDASSACSRTKRRRRGSWKSDENHNERCSSASSSMISTGDEEVATDLSLRSNVTVASADCLPPNSVGGVTSVSTNEKISKLPLGASIKQETDVMMLHAAMARTMVSPCTAGGPMSTQFPFPSFLPQSLHQQMQMAVMTQAAMRYMQPLCANMAAAAGHNPSPSASSFYSHNVSFTDDETTHDSSSSTNGEVMGVVGTDSRRKRSRVFIDPLSEIPRLEQWFSADSHPSASVIEQVTDELNRSTYRQRFPKLEPKNVQLWFKNHRAKVKRQSVDGSPTITLPLIESAACMNPFVDKLITLTKEENDVAV